MPLPVTDEELASLSDHPEEAFVQLVDIMSKWLEQAAETGDRRAREKYVQILRAFADERNLDVPFRAYSMPVPMSISPGFWDKFSADVDYAASRFRFKNRSGSTTSAPTVMLNAIRRDEIHKLIGKIRKVVAVLDITEDKRDKIYGILSNLAREVDQSKTRPATLMALILETSETVGQAAEKLNPLARLIKQLTGMVADQKAENDQAALPKPAEQKQLPPPAESPQPESDSESPF